MGKTAPENITLISSTEIAQFSIGQDIKSCYSMENKLNQKIMFRSKNKADNLQISDAVKNCQAELSQAVANSLSGKRNDMAGFIQDKYDTVKHKAQQMTGQFRNRKEDAVYKIDRQVDAYNNKLEMMARQWPGQLDRLVHRYPWVVLLTVLSIGIILGFLLSPGRNYRR